MGGRDLVLFAISTALAWYSGTHPIETSHATVVERSAHHIGWMTWQEWQYGSQRRAHVRPLLTGAVHPLSTIPVPRRSGFGVAEPRPTPCSFLRLGGLTIAFAQLWLTVAVVRRMCRRCSPVAILAVRDRSEPDTSAALHTCVSQCRRADDSRCRPRRFAVTFACGNKNSCAWSTPSSSEFRSRSSHTCIHALLVGAILLVVFASA